MVEGALARSRCRYRRAVTGIAGPGRRHGRKAGRVWSISPPLRRGGQPVHAEHRFGDIGRSDVRLATVARGLARCCETLIAAAIAQRLDTP